jgi:hypothetical protein
MHDHDIEKINDLIMGEILYDDNIIMNNHNLGNHIITTTQNGSDLIYHKSSTGSRYIPDTPKDDTIVYTENHLNHSEVEEKKQMVDLINEMHSPSTNYEPYLKNNRIGQFYFGSLAVVGLFIVYRMIQMTK